MIMLDLVHLYPLLIFICFYCIVFDNAYVTCINLHLPNYPSLVYLSFLCLRCVFIMQAMFWMNKA